MKRVTNGDASWVNQIVATPAKALVIAVAFYSAIMFTSTASAGLLDSVYSKVDQIWYRLSAVKSNVDETIAELRASRVDFSTNVRAAITDAREDISKAIDERRAGRDDWVTYESENFRYQIIGLVQDLGTLSSSLLSASGLGQSDNQKLVDILQLVPARALFPIHKAFTQEFDLFASPFVMNLKSTASAMAEIEAMLYEATCDEMTANAEDYAFSIQSAKVAALGLQLVGKRFEGLGTKQVTKEAGAWGFVGFSVENNRLKKFGIMIHSGGDVLAKYAGLAKSELDRCTTLTAHEEIMQGQANILIAIAAIGDN